MTRKRTVKGWMLPGGAMLALRHIQGKWVVDLWEAGDEPVTQYFCKSREHAMIVIYTKRIERGLR